MKMLKNIYLIIKYLGFSYFMGVLKLYKTERRCYANFRECLEDEIFYNGLEE